MVAYKELTTFLSEWEVWERCFQGVVSFQVWKNVIQVFKFQVLNSKCVKEFSSKCPRISKCGRKFFKLLKVSTLKFEKVCGREFFELLKSFNIQV